jgi:hypothetical protein
MGTNTITNLEDPSNAHDAVNKQYVDSNYVNISNFRSRLIGSSIGWPAAPGIFEILIPATKRYLGQLNLLHSSKQII